MPLFVIHHDAEIVRILNCLRWRDCTEGEVVEKFNRLYPRRTFDVPSSLKRAVADKFVAVRKRGGLDEFFITRRGLDVLDQPKKKEET